MISFPKKLIPNNINRFKEYNFNRNLCYLRQEIYEFIISRKDEKTTFDYYRFNMSRGVEDMDITNRMVDIIVIELSDLGWSCEKAYGNTVLYIVGSKNTIKNMTILN